MINKKYIELLRSRKRSRENNFIYKIIAKRIIDSLDVLNLKISNVLEIGINNNEVNDYLKHRFFSLNIDRIDFYSFEKNKSYESNFLETDFDESKIKKNYYDFIYSNCLLYLVSDFEKTLKFIFENLNTNGIFICVIPDKQNMFQLANSMYESDQLIYDGIFQRFNPTFEINNILSILKKLSYDAPSIHCDSINISYNKFQVLLNDIRLMGLSYCHKDKKQKFEKKSYFETVEYFYRKNYFKEKFLLDIKINIVTAWKK